MCTSYGIWLNCVYPYSAHTSRRSHSGIFIHSTVRSILRICYYSRNIRVYISFGCCTCNWRRYCISFGCYWYAPTQWYGVNSFHHVIFHSDSSELKVYREPRFACPASNCYKIPHCNEWVLPSPNGPGIAISPPNAICIYFPWLRSSLGPSFWHKIANARTSWRVLTSIFSSDIISG